MNDKKASELLQNIRDIYSAEKFSKLEKLVPAMSLYRERIKEIENPLLVKVIRLTYEHLEEYKDFLINYVDSEEVGGLNNFEYLMQLWSDPDNKYNREDLQMYRDMLKIYPDPLPIPAEEESEEGSTTNTNQL